MKAKLLSILTPMANQGPNIAPTVNPVYQIIGTIIPIILSLISVYYLIRCIALGYAFSKSDENGTHEKAKKDLIHAIEGFILMFVLSAVMWLLREPMIEWLEQITNNFQV